MPAGVQAPAGGYTNGRPVLFFVRAIYDYVASVPEEFSFQEDDVIAVFATDPDVGGKVNCWTRTGDILAGTSSHLISVHYSNRLIRAVTSLVV